ncbi:MAG: hypothetical protein AAF846_23555 [Chloroflexota bacterium]
MKKGFVTINIIIIFLFFLSASITQSTEDTPYLYYYSTQEQAFIIEKADGSDSKILAMYELPPEHTLINGAGWSYTGTWFAWSSSAVGGAGGNKNIYLTDGIQTLTVLLEPTPQPIYMVWSPNNDLLLVSYYPNIESTVQDVIIFDPNTGSNVFQASIKEYTNSSVYWLQSIDWSPNGQYLHLINGRTVEIIDPFGDFYLTISTPHIGYTGCNNFGTLPRWLSETEIAYWDQSHNELRVWNVVSDSLQEAISLPQGQPQSIDWSPNSTSALIYIKPTTDVNSTELWFASIESELVEIVHESVIFQNNCNIPFNQTAWFDSERAIFINQDNHLGFVTLEPDMSVISDLYTGVQIINGTTFRWTDKDNIVFIGRSNPQGQGYLYNLDLILGESESTLLLDESVFQTSQYISHVKNGYILFDEWILEVISGNYRPIFNNEILIDNSDFTLTNASWHPDGEWIFVRGNSSSTDDTVYVISPNNSIERQISTCFSNISLCYGWLP